MTADEPPGRSDAPVAPRGKTEASRAGGLHRQPAHAGERVAPGAPLHEDLQHAVAFASLACLVGASAVGVLLAALLLWPEAGAPLGPVTYGRWMPVHLDVQLFGWCSLPVIGVLMKRMLPPRSGWLLAARVALAAWLGALTAGVLDWLSGRTSGKLFLDWSGPDDLAFAAAQILLWLVLAAGWWSRRRDRAPLWQRAADAGLLAMLAGVPVALHLAAQPAVYPPVNPHSGGATGHSLLASSLGVVGIALVLPALLGRPARRRIVQEALTVFAIFAANWAVYLYIGHGNASNHDAEQIAGLGTLLVWPPVLVWWFRLYHWEPSQWRWLATTAVWCALLVVDGFVLFLPGVLDRLKFTNALVAHSHLAMAGLLTALNMLILVSLAPRTRLAAALDRRGWWLVWNLATAVMIGVLTWVGMQESSHPLAVYDGTFAVTAGYVVRLLSGIAMLAAAFAWIAAARRTARHASTNESISVDPALSHAS